MKYLVVCAGAQAEQVLCANETEAAEWVQEKLRCGSSESDIEVYTAEQLSFQVERVPVVKLAERAEADSAAASEYDGPVSTNDSDSFTNAFSDITEGTEESLNPFASEQVFSLDT